MKAAKWILSIFLGFSVLFVTIFGINCLYGYLFPIKFQEEVTAASEESGLDEAVIFSVINIESRFNPNAVSSKGAVGLMQLMPSTAQEVAASLSQTARAYLESVNMQNFEKIINNSENDKQKTVNNLDNNEREIFIKNSENGEKDDVFVENLKNPATNIMLGAKFLKSLLTRFENLDTALCAYNAGPATVKAWLANSENSSDGKTLSKIPYAETKTYLDKFHKNLKYYSSKIK